PQLLAGLDVDRRCCGMRGDVEHALMDDRLRFFGAVVVQAVVPDRRKLANVRGGDLLERAVALQVVAHAVVQDFAGICRTLCQIGTRLAQREGRNDEGEPGDERRDLHFFLPESSDRKSLLDPSSPGSRESLARDSGSVPDPSQGISLTHCEKVLRAASPRASMCGLWRE